MRFIHLRSQLRKIGVSLVVLCGLLGTTMIAPKTTNACIGNLCGFRQAQNSCTLTLPVGSESFQLGLSNILQSNINEPRINLLSATLNGSHFSTWNGPNTASISSGVSINVLGSGSVTTAGLPAGASISIVPNSVTASFGDVTPAVGKDRRYSYSGATVQFTGLPARISTITQTDTATYQFGSTVRVISCPVTISGGAVSR